MTNAEDKKIDTRFRVICLECGKKWRTYATMPVCPRCNSVDVEPQNDE